MTACSYLALRRLLLVTAAVCLLGTGGIDLLRTPASAAPSASSGAAPRAGAEPVAPAALSALRSALAAATPLSGGGDVGPPSAGPSLTPRPTGAGPSPVLLAAAPVVPVRGPDGRGPPRTTGT